MTYPKIRPCPECGNADAVLYGYDGNPAGTWTCWHVECDDCHYMGPGGNKLQAIREHNSRAAMIAAAPSIGGEG